jgi:hypothetical protein
LRAQFVASDNEVGPPDVRPNTTWRLAVNDQQFRKALLEREQLIQAAWAAARRVIKEDETEGDSWRPMWIALIIAGMILLFLKLLLP